MKGLNQLSLNDRLRYTCVIVLEFACDITKEQPTWGDAPVLPNTVYISRSKYCAAIKEGTYNIRYGVRFIENAEVSHCE